MELRLMRNWRSVHDDVQSLGRHWRIVGWTECVALHVRSSSFSFLASQLSVFVPWLYRHERVNRALYHREVERWGPTRRCSTATLRSHCWGYDLHRRVWSRRWSPRGVRVWPGMDERRISCVKLMIFMILSECQWSFLGRLGRINPHLLMDYTCINLAAFWKTFIVAISNENLLNTAKSCRLQSPHT